MFLRIIAAALVWSVAAAVVPPVHAQTPSQQESGDRKVGMATRAATPPNIDGTLDDAVWQQASALTDFVQTEPDEGARVSERTEVRILYDDDNVYVGVICYDSDPSQIIVTDARRDSSLSEADSFQIIFDTYLDRQNGFVFGTTPSGVEYDAQLRNEGSTGANQSGGAALGGSAARAPERAAGSTPIGTRHGRSGRGCRRSGGVQSSGSRCAICGTVRRPRYGA